MGIVMDGVGFSVVPRHGRNFPNKKRQFKNTLHFLTLGII